MPRLPQLLARAWPAWLLGLPGLVALALLAPLPPEVPRALAVVQPALVLALAAMAGAWGAPRAGLRLWAAPRRLGEFALVGLLLGLALAAADHAAHALWQPLRYRPPSLVQGWSWVSLGLGLTYGGLTEEVMLRWGVMAPLAALFLRHGVRGALIWAGLLSALVFALGHLPALALQEVPWTAPLLARTLGLNLLAGLFFAHAFARAGLTAAMACHAACHLGFALAAALAAALA